jgi:hypothetical protein
VNDGNNRRKIAQVERNLKIFRILDESFLGIAEKITKEEVHNEGGHESVEEGNIRSAARMSEPHRQIESLRPDRADRGVEQDRDVDVRQVRTFSLDRHPGHLR